jgi:protein-tyrosine phosphatase
MNGTILVVCEGNVCRSPMACALLAHRLPRARVVSAGTGALVGKPADSTAIALMSEQGIDLRGHVATLLNLQHVRDAALVLTMTATQCNEVVAAYRFAKGRVYRLCEHASVDVVDPFRRDRATFEASLKQIEQGVARWLDVLARAPI